MSKLIVDEIESPTGVLDIEGSSIDFSNRTSPVNIPAGTSDQRGTAAEGQLRYNYDYNSLEVYNGTKWSLLKEDKDKNGIIKPGLVLHLDAGDIDSYPGHGNMWYDLSGNHNDATLINTPTFTGNSLRFNGSNEYAVIQKSRASDSFKTVIDGFSMMIGCQSFNSDTAWHCIMSWGDGVNYMDYWQQSGSRDFGSDADGHYTQGAADMYDAGFKQWGHTVDRTALVSKLYHSGELVNTKATTRTVKTVGTYDFRIAARPEPTLYYMNIDIKYILIYDRPLTDAEMLQNYQALQSRIGG